MSFQLPAIRKLCPDACQRIQALDTKRPVARLAKGDLLGMCYAFPASWVHGQSYASITPSSAVHNLILNTWIFTTKTILVLAACS